MSRQALAQTKQPMSREEIVAAFEGRIEPVRVGAPYKLGLLAVALVMVLLPLVYVAMIVLVAWVMYLHATHVGPSLGHIKSARAAMLVYATPLVVGGVLILFMIKPLLARAPKEPALHSLDKARNPLLQAFLEKIAEALGAPVPRRIDVDCNVNASASFRRGLWSFFGNDLVLTLGLPLLRSLNTRELAGVVAHELGHFAQGTGMRLTYVIRAVSYWFLRVVYQRDAWDAKLAQWSHVNSFYVMIPLMIARLMVWLTRRVLWVLMQIGQVVSCFMLRQMEYDADRHEARLAGSEPFETVSRRMMVLGLAWQGAMYELQNSWQQRQLCDDLPLLAQSNVRNIPAKVLHDISQAAGKERTGWLDTHPCDRDRIRSARKEEAQGIFRLERAAADLVSDLDGLSRQVTLEYYQSVIGPEVGTDNLIPTGLLVLRQKNMVEVGKALGRFFQGQLSPDCPLLLARRPTAPGSSRQAIGAIREVRDRIVADRPKAQEAMEQCSRAESDKVDATRACALVEAGQAYCTRQGLNIRTRQAANTAYQSAVDQSLSLRQPVDAFLDLARRRLLDDLRLLSDPQIAPAIPDVSTLAHSSRTLLSTLVELSDNWQLIQAIRLDHESLVALLERLQKESQNKKLLDASRLRLARLHENLKLLRQQLQASPYPFEHANADIDVGQHVVEQIPPSDDLGVISSAETAIERFLDLYFRVLGELARIAETVESAVGLPPMPDPPEEAQAAAPS